VLTCGLFCSSSYSGHRWCCGYNVLSSFSLCCMMVIPVLMVMCLRLINHKKLEWFHFLLRVLWYLFLFLFNQMTLLFVFFCCLWSSAMISLSFVFSFSFAFLWFLLYFTLFFFSWRLCQRVWEKEDTVGA